MSFQGPLGLDDPDQIRADLEAGTGLTWRVEEVYQENVLVGGLTEILLVAVVSKSTELIVSAAMDRAKMIVREIRTRRLDPLKTTGPAREDVQEPGPAGAPQSDPHPQDDIQDAIPAPEDAPTQPQPARHRSALSEPGA